MIGIGGARESCSAEYEELGTRQSVINRPLHGAESTANVLLSGDDSCSGEPAYHALFVESVRAWLPPHEVHAG